MSSDASNPPPGQESKPTQRTIANITGLAVTTVSRALAGDEKIAKKTRRQVADVAEEIGYVPDRAAQRLRTGRTNVIALVLDPHSEILGFSASMITGVASVLHDTAYHLILMQYGIAEAPMTPIHSIVRNRLADGIILARTEPRDDRVEYLMRARFPFVTHGRTDLPGHAWLDYDNAAFAEMAVKHLAGRGRKRIALVAPDARYSFHRHMIDGFQAAAQRHRIHAITPEDFDLNSPPDQIGAGVTTLMAGDAPPDGWICPGEMSAMAVHAALYDMGATLGRDVDIVAKQTSQAFNLFRPAVPAIYEDIEASGVGLAKLLLKRISGEDATGLNYLQRPVWPA